MPGSKVLAIGIDVGTSKCCVAGVRNGKVEVYENERSRKTTPSVVAFTDTMRLVGDEAKEQWTMNPHNTVSGIKRILGKSYEQIGDVKINLPCLVNEGGDPMLDVTYKAERKKFLPEQILAMLLTKMKQIAEFNLGYTVDKAVISVPTTFDERQRQATMDAATIAGLEVLELLNEPTAAAITYRDNRGSCDETLLVLDYGGGSLDSGTLRIDNRKVELLSVYGEPTIGGVELDTLLANHYAEEFAREKRHKVADNVKAMTKLLLQCERQKHTLSLLTSVNIQIDCMVNDVDLSSSIRRDRFQLDICDSYLHHTLYPALDRALQQSDSTRVILVGGSTRIPFVQEYLTKAGKVLDKSVNLDEAVAHGAAIRAALLAKDSYVEDFDVKDRVGATVLSDHEKLNPYIVQEMDFRRDEENEKLRIVAMNDLEKSCLACDDESLRVEILDWLYDNPMATKEEFMDKKKLVSGLPSREESKTPVGHSSRETSSAANTNSTNDRPREGSDVFRVPSRGRPGCPCRCSIL